MAVVRDFSSYVSKLNNDDSDNTSYKEKIRNHKLAVFFRTVAIVAITAVLVATIYISWRDKEYSESVISDTTTITNGADSKVISLSGYMVQYSKDGVSCLDSMGKVLWNQTYEMQSPIAHTCENVVAIGDYNGHNIYVNNTGGALGEIDTNLPIRDFCVASNGVVAAVLDGTDVTWIYIYDSVGNMLVNFKTTMKDSGYPISISLSPNGELLCVSYLSTENGDLKTRVAFFNFGSVGQNYTDNFVSSYDYSGVVVPYVQFMNGSAAFAVSDDRIMFYSGNQKPVSKSESFTGSEEVRSVYFNESYVGLVFPNSTEDGAYRLQVYDTAGNLTLTSYFDIEYSEIIFNNKQIIIYNEDECIIQDMTGHVKFHGEFTTPVRTMIPTAVRSKFMLVTPSNLQTMTLK
ncbi:DUF5711 family protein [Butyrivibrio proteoclasticus]|uniref:DUF5711 family protein n=1 Tax=Butyrivibrio proteoclasticus TaxID=43305 RepID=UPI00047A93C9|nr:DUF5711 family protein [Butyrivibrio proteoclasticus]